MPSFNNKNKSSLMNKTQLAFDIGIFKNESDSCKSVKDCTFIKKLLASLKYYSLLDINNNIDNGDVFCNFIDQVYNQVLNHYIHLVNNHGNDLNEIDTSIIKCDNIKNCKFTMRHHDNDKTDKEEKGLEPKLTFYKNTMDSLHFFLFHLYHTGMRTIKTNDDINDNDNDKIDDEMKDDNDKEYFDKVFYRLNKQIKERQHLTK
eukprot:513586_1